MALLGINGLCLTSLESFDAELHRNVCRLFLSVFNGCVVMCSNYGCVMVMMVVSLWSSRGSVVVVSCHGYVMVVSWLCSCVKPMVELRVCHDHAFLCCGHVVVGCCCGPVVAMSWLDPGCVIFVMIWSFLVMPCLVIVVLWLCCGRVVIMLRLCHGCVMSFNSCHVMVLSW